MTCKDCVHYEACGGFTPTDLDKDVFDYCIKGTTDEIPDIDKRCGSFKNKADFVEVVRCKDCQYAKLYERNDGQMGYYCQHQNCTFLYGTNWERLFEPTKEANDFCSYGERRCENDS